MKMATLVENIIGKYLFPQQYCWQVRSWAELLNRVEKDGRMSALLVSYPLFDALFKAEGDWLTRALGYLPCSKKLQSACRPEAVGVQVSQHFDTLVDLNISDVPCPSTLPDTTSPGRVGRARHLAGDILVNAKNLCDAGTAVDLSEQTKSCDEMIRTQINYQGEDEEKEKQQGYARNSRQRAVAMVIKESQTIGLNARKAMTVNQEELTRSSLTEVLEGFGVEVNFHSISGQYWLSSTKALFHTEACSKLCSWSKCLYTKGCCS
ncbi:hypothetical protein ANCDUO_07505 [Ancylostoma duodenale]|uniref:Uncharacterized protein n=1 Tax=Ancylostoma duodenale TaxID=51022 RepID=A0A0C2DIB1_9BILA|nr:hypothetical protein ANCDUO_07505 [Ancylostoma duodenale]